MRLRRSQKREYAVATHVESESEDTASTSKSKQTQSGGAAKKKPRAAAASSSSSKSVAIPIAPSSDDGGADRILFTYERLVPGRLVRRYKRFLADIELVTAAREPSGTTEDTVPVDAAKVVTVYCPNTGPMVGLLDLPNARVQLSKSDDPKRKYQYTLEMIQVDNGERRVWVGVHSTLANRMVERAIAAQWLPELGLFSSFQREVKFSTNSRVDFVLSGEGPNGVVREKYVEVKSVSFAHPIGSSSGEEAQEATASSEAKRFCALFPDTISERAQKHVTELTELVESRAKKAASAKQTSAAIVFVVQRNDCHEFAPSFLHDKQFTTLCARAAEKNVQLLGYSVALEPEEENERGHARLLHALPLYKHVQSESDGTANSGIDNDTESQQSNQSKKAKQSKKTKAASNASSSPAA